MALLKVDLKKLLGSSAIVRLRPFQKRFDESIAIIAKEFLDDYAARVFIQNIMNRQDPH